MATAITTPLAARLRVLLMLTHTIGWLAILICSVVLSEDPINWIMATIHALSGVALVIYVPAALYVTWRGSDTRFDHAGGEVAYIAVQLVAWFASGVFDAMMVRWQEYCYVPGTTWRPSNPALHDRLCRTYLGVSIASFVQMIILAVWLGIVVYRVQRVPGLSMTQAYKISTHKLLDGTSAPNMVAEETDVEALVGMTPRRVASHERFTSDSA